MKQLLLSPSFIKQLELIKKRDPKLFQQIHKQLRIFKTNPLHPSLRLHKLSGNLQQIWSISANRSTRILYRDEPDVYYFFDLGTHDQVYR